MPKPELPRFVIYQPNEKEFYICLEANGRYLRWCSNYAPASDVRFAREVKRIDDMPLQKTPKKGIFDEGTYTITQSKKDSKEAIQQKLVECIERNSCSFVLNGKVLKGRFAFKRSRNGTVIQKFKDKYAVEEDVLGADLVRTINAMVPDYDETKVTLTYPAKKKRRKIYQPESELPQETEDEEVVTAEQEPIEELTADKTIGKTDYNFAYYTSDNGDKLCLVTNAAGEVLVIRKEQDEWEILPPVNRSVLKKEKEFAEHAKALYEAGKG